MADEQQAPLGEDKPEVLEQAPDSFGEGQAETPKEFFSDSFNPDEIPEELRGAYDSMRADYTRKTQEIAEQRREAEQAQSLISSLQNPLTQAEALRALGLELDEGDDALSSNEDEYVDPEDEIRQIKAYLAEQEQEKVIMQAEEAFLDNLARDIDGLEQREKRQLTDDEQAFILSHAQAQLADGETPNVQAAYAMLNNIATSARERYVASKKQAPLAPLGAPGDKKINLDDPEERVQALARIAEANLSQD